MSMTETYPQLLASLDDLRRQWRLRQVLTGGLLTFAGATAVLAAVVAIDNLFHVGTAGRLLLAVLLWGSLAAAVLAFIIRRFLEDRRDDFFAVLVEQKYPELRNQLINALQLGRGTINGFSPRLIEAIVDDAARATADMEMANSLDSRPVKRAGLIALVAVIVIAGYAVALTPRF